MDASRFDEVVRRLARPTTRRHLVRGFVAGVAVAIAGPHRRSIMAQGSTPCASDAECGPGAYCDQDLGACILVACADFGAACTSSSECCDTLLCEAGVCVESVTCGLQGESCGDRACCPGLICDGAVCIPEAPAPSEPQPDGNSGGGGSSQDPNPAPVQGTGNGGTTTASGATSGGAAVIALPQTGVGPQPSGEALSATLGITAAAAVVLRTAIRRWPGRHPHVG